MSKSKKSQEKTSCSLNFFYISISIEYKPIKKLKYQYGTGNKYFRNLRKQTDIAFWNEETVSPKPWKYNIDIFVCFLSE